MPDRPGAHRRRETPVARLMDYIDRYIYVLRVRTVLIVLAALAVGITVILLLMFVRPAARADTSPRSGVGTATQPTAAATPSAAPGEHVRPGAPVTPATGPVPLNNHHGG